MKIQVVIKHGKKQGIIVCDSISPINSTRFIAYFHDDKEHPVRVYNAKIITVFPVPDNEYYVNGDARDMQVQ